MGYEKDVKSKIANVSYESGVMFSNVIASTQVFSCTTVPIDINIHSINCSQ